MFFIKCAAIFIGTFGYATIINIPKKHLFHTAFTAMAGYCVYLLMLPSEIIGCFLGACVIAALGEIFSRTLKDAATLFIIPGIIPLVPGAKMYNMTLSLIRQDFNEAATLGVQVLMYAGGIAIAILLVSSTVRSVAGYASKIKKNKYKGPVHK